MTTGVLMLAGGQSRRFGSDKREAKLGDGNTLLIASANNALASGLPLLVCLRPGDEALATTLTNLGAGTVFCSQAADGMGRTLAQGIAQLPPWETALIVLGDMPFIDPATYCKVASSTSHGAICQPCYQGQPGHPVGFSHTFFPDLGRLHGDEGARSVLKQNEEAVLRLPVDDPGILRDIDLPADLP